MELPKQFLKNMEMLLDTEYEAFLDSYNKERVYGLRVNNLKITTEEFAAAAPFELEKIPWIHNGFYYNGQIRPARDPYYYAGLYYLQEPSAMIPASVLPVSPGMKVLDLCAAPGGKSTELAAKLRGEGVLVSNDISNSRAKALLKNIELFGVRNAVVMSEAPYRLAERFPEYFDRILIDAPCSGEGMFRKDPSVIKGWLEHGNEFFSKLQKEIVAQALKMLAPGGMLLYSTCTFSPMEDEQIVQYMLDLDPRLSVAGHPWPEGFSKGRPDWAGGNEALSDCIRVWPHKIRGEGHFAALLKKENDSVPEYNSLPGTLRHSFAKTFENGRRAEDLPAELDHFLDSLDTDIDKSEVFLREEKAYAHGYTEPFLPGEKLQGLRILRSGLLLGECRKKRFEPSQALAMALKAEEYPFCISLERTDDRVIRYLKGETIESDVQAAGLALICVDGHPLGFGKVSGTTVKNKYLSGWRWM